MRKKIMTMLVCALILFPVASPASGTVRRFVLAAGANFGGPKRVQLRYAVSDAAKFDDIMMKMGGVAPEDQLLLSEPDLKNFREALEDLQTRVGEAKPGAGRTEVLFYYSGHADENGLLLGEERLAYGVLREMMDAIEADVRITILDACASGAITRIKGGQRQKAFLVDDSSNMQGYAFLTSSSADEAAQESDRIGASFFTHYLVSGMRGAADVSGEGKVTLNEAYQFAFHETLARTTETQGGAQHPAYQINLSGTGDVVITDLRQTSAGLLISEEMSGRFFVRNENQQLVAEVFKPAGRSIELGLEPGAYEIHLEQKKELYLTTVELSDGDRLLLGPADFEPGEQELTVQRGIPEGFGQIGPPGISLSGRSRVELSLGFWSAGPRTSYETEAIIGDGIISTRVQSWDLVVGLSYARWLREDLALGLNLSALGGEVTSEVGSDISTQTMGLVSLMINGRKYLPASTLQSELRPFLSLGIGTYIASTTESTVGSLITTTVETMTAFAGQVGTGLDIQVSRHFMLGTRINYNIVSDFDQPFAGRKNYSGFDFSVGFNFLFGRGHASS